MGEKRKDLIELYKGTFLERYAIEKIGEDEEPTMSPMDCIKAVIDDYNKKRGVLFRNDFQLNRGSASLVPHNNPELSSYEMILIENEKNDLYHTINKTHSFLFAHLKKGYKSFMKKYRVWNEKDSLNEYYTVLKKYIDFQRELIDYILNVNNSIDILKKQKSTAVVNCFTALKEQIEEKEQQNENKQWDDYFYKVISDYLNNYNQQSPKIKSPKTNYEKFEDLFCRRDISKKIISLMEKELAYYNDRRNVRGASIFRYLQEKHIIYNVTNCGFWNLYNKPYENQEEKQIKYRAINSYLNGKKEIDLDVYEEITREIDDIIK